MTLIFVSKYSKFNVDSKNAVKRRQNVFTFLDNCIRIGSSKFSLLLRRILVVGSQRVKKKPQHRCFPVKFAKLTPFLQSSSSGCFRGLTRVFKGVRNENWCDC